MAGALVWLSQENRPAPDAPTGNPKSAVLGSPRLVSVSPASISALVHAEEGDNALPTDFYEVLPASLSNAGSPAPLVRDANGSVSADSRLRRLFDFYLNAIGEEPLEHIVARIRHALGQQLSGAALEEALGVTTDGDSSEGGSKRAGGIEVHFEVKTRSEAGVRSDSEPISVYVTLRSYEPVRDLRALPAALDRLTSKGQSLIEQRVLPCLVNPIREAIGSGGF